MSHAKKASNRKRKAVPVLGAAGLLSLAGGATAVNAAPATDLPALKTAPTHEITLGEEEISGVSLGTFYVFDKENVAQEPSIKLARGGCGAHGGGCGGHGGGCGGRGGGCGGRGCGGRGGGGRGCGGRGCGCWGGCGCGCCLSTGGCGLC